VLASAIARRMPFSLKGSRKFPQGQKWETDSFLLAHKLKQ